jgi:transcriptional regulator with XRE-family HTH domain
MGALHPSAVRRNRQRTIMVDGPNPIDIHVGARIRAQRVVRGLTQSDLARLVGISFQSVQKYEQGENRVSASRLYEFAQVLGVAPQHFFDGLDNHRSGDTLPGLPVPADGELRRRLLSVMAIEDKRLRQLIVQLLNVLSELSGAKPGEHGIGD